LVVNRHLDRTQAAGYYQLKTEEDIKQDIFAFGPVGTLFPLPTLGT
jgi:hypothetical protein